MNEEHVTIKQGLSTGWVILIVLIVLIIGGSLGYWYAGKNKVDQAEVSPSPTTSIAPTKTPSTTPTATSSSDWKNVSFENYGFSLELTDNWQKYRYEEQKPDDGATAWIRFYLPTNDTVYESSEMPGYTNPFVISVYTKAQWDAVDMDGPHDVYIGENNDYVIAFSQWQACPPDLCDVINSEDLDAIKDSIKVF